MLDRHDGAFLLDDGQRIDPTTTRAQFLAEPLGARAEPGRSWGPAEERWSSYAVTGCVSEGSAWRLDVKFRNDRLFEIELRPDGDAGAAGWEQWSLDAELAKVRAYEAVAERWVGPAPRVFTWGWVSAAFDERGGGAHFIVRYTPEATR